MGEIDWGPVSSWAAAVATVLATLTSLLVAFRVPDSFRSPRLRTTFENKEPWCRSTELEGTVGSLWVRIGVENVGGEPARGCVGRLIGLTTDGVVRADVDPVQLRWAGVPRSRSFAPMDIRHDQREFLNVLCLDNGRHWRIVTFEDSDFDPGFCTDLAPDQEHVLHIAVFSDNADTRTLSLVAGFRSVDGAVTLRLA
jgi:hypothetical protein